MADEDILETMGDEDAAKAKPRRRNMIFGSILLGVMLLEGLAVVFMVKHFGPDPASAGAAQVAGLDADGGALPSDEVEIEVTSFRAQNEQSRQLVLYDVVIWVSVAKEDAESFQKLVEGKQATIKDRLSSVVRAADPQVLSEPDPASLRQQFHRELNTIVGDEETIQRVMIPSIMPWRS